VVPGYLLRFRPSGQLRSSRQPRQTHLVGGTDTKRFAGVGANIASKALARASD